MLLGFAGVLAAGLSIIAAFGLVSACGMSFVSIVGNVPFLLIGMLQLGFVKLFSIQYGHVI